jgi:capsular exopolysaccharide synthesis family protein
VGAIVSGLTTFFITRGITPTYEATASILVVNQAQGTPPTDPAGVVQLSDILISDRLMKTYAELVDRPVILETVSQRLNGVYTAETLATKVSVSNTPIDTQILKIAVRDQSPNLAASIANVTAQAFIEENAREIGRPGTVSISQSAVVPSSPVEPKVGLYTVLSALVGFVVAAVFARGLEYLDDTIKTPDDISTVLDLPTIGVIGMAGPRGLQKALGRVSGRADLSPFLEDVRELRTRIHFLKLDTDLRTLVVVSQNPDEGKTTTAASLAEVLAEAGDQVILVDANLRRPRLHEIYGVANTVGLTGLLMQDVESVMLSPTRVKNLRLLTSGPVPLSPSELLTSKRMMQTLASLRENADFVIFDTPPLASASDALILASKVDGTLPVIQAGRARSQDVRQTIARLQEAKARILGIVLNKAKSPDRHYSYGQQATFGQEHVEMEAVMAPVRREPHATTISRRANGASGGDARRTPPAPSSRGRS